jgi:hypothetical protein
MQTLPGFDDFLAAYTECLLWSEKDCTPDGDISENFEDAEDDLAPEAVADIWQDCVGFYEMSAGLIGEDGDWSQAGHDFALTRNGHGAGFWDGGWDELGAELTKLAKSFGTQGLYRGGDGKIYTHN